MSSNVNLLMLSHSIKGESLYIIEVLLIYRKHVPIEICQYFLSKFNFSLWKS